MSDQELSVADAEPFEGEWHLDKYSHGVWSNDSQGRQIHVADVRGWGYLTGRGSGACGLPHDQAVAIQRATGNLIVASKDLRAICQRILARRPIGGGASDVALSEQDLLDLEAAVRVAEEGRKP